MTSKDKLPVVRPRKRSSFQFSIYFMINSQSVRIIFISSLLVFLMIEVSRAAEIPMTLAVCIATAVREHRAIKNAYLDSV